MDVRRDDWPRVKAVLEGAMALDGAARSAYVVEACGGDAALRQYVEALLDSHDRSRSFLETPAAVTLVTLDRDEKLTGRLIGGYRIEARIGAGGMGEVYRAHDEKLQRTVALKLLPRHFAADPERLDRFRVEAQTASALNHPNILVVHDFDQYDGRPFIVTEHVDGVTLRERLRAGAVPIGELLDIAVQVASALAAAHERGVLHRDIKPENVMVRPDGYVKVLDFGLAKLARVSDDGSRILTRTGVVMGTAQYMSPEQARGQPVDFRSDQFSFGAVLYELATGRSAFARGSTVESAAAVIGEHPESIDRVCPQAPPPLRWAIERCLAKKPADRYGSTRDLHHDLATVRERLAEARPAAAAPAGSNLPVPTTALVGREHDVAFVTTLLARDDVRWVTLTGPGGVGKTRLAIHVAADLSPRYDGAVYFVPLANVTDFHLVPSAIAETLDIRPQGGESALQALKRHLRIANARLLLVIDNFEHVADAAPSVTELVEGSPGLKILASSRAGLHVSAEREYQVPTLALPDRRPARSTVSLATSPAVALFVDRARAVRPDFQISDDNAPAIADICVALDGLPLAIELAAARVKVLPPAALLARLAGKRLSLAGGARDLPARQQALRNTIEWSYGLLTPAEQRLFRRLAVFVGGWTLEAAEAVCDAREDVGIDVLDGIASLVDKSLVRPIDARDSEARFTMLETIREYGLEKLAEAGESAATRRAHAAYCLVLAEEGSMTSDAASQLPWLAQCDAEHTNVRAALDCLAETGDAPWAMRLASAMLPFWQARAHLAEGRDHLTRVLRLGDPSETTELRARATFALGTLLYSMGEPAQAAQIHDDRVLTMYRALADRRGIGVSLNAIATCHRAQRQYAASRRVFEEALSVWRELGDEHATTRTLSNLATVAFDEGDYERARALYREVRAACDRLGDRAGAAWAINFEAQVEQQRGDRGTARALYLEALARFRAIRDAWGTGDSLLALGHMACDDNQSAEAHRLFEEAHAVFAASRDTRGLVRIIEAFARLAVQEGRPVQALTLAGAAAAVRHTLSVRLPPFERDALERALDTVRRGPDAQRAGAAWIEGWAMSAEEAVQYALTSH